MSRADGVLRRVNARDSSAEDANNHAQGDSYDCGDFKETHLTLMEEVMLLGLKDERGYLSLWNGCISSGLRGCILMELGFRNRIVMEKANKNRKELLARHLLLKSDIETGNFILDEALATIKDANSPETVQCWIEYLSGEAFRPDTLKIKYELRNVRERLTKSLVEKGILGTKERNFFFFSVTTYPISDYDIKYKLVKRIQDAVLCKWVNDPQRMDKHMLALIILAYASNVLDNALCSLSTEDHAIAMRRVRKLLDFDCNEEAAKPNADELLWAICMALTK